MPQNKPLQAIRFYGVELSGHAHRVKLFLHMLDLPFETMDVKLDGHYNRSPEFLAISPFGQVPAIQDGDVVLHDSNAILVYLASRYGDPSWLPADPVSMAAVQRWLSLAAGHIFNGPCAARLVKVFGLDLDYERALQVSQRLLEVIELEFSGKLFAIGDTPTIADIAAYSYIAHAPEGGVSLEAYSNVRRWLRRVEALDRFIPMPPSNAAGA
ncbi:glutathione S-transferase family protein [Undibacterium sp. TJN25]|uniref:glutathione S-transferase family protein n=1 Tax=Undibacterium sp. TJN25 TaxID=3413056 RepID=UPI003BF37714